MLEAIEYSSAEFLEDYHLFASRSKLLADATPGHAAVLTKAFFAMRYSHSPEVTQERMNLFLKVMVAIESNHEKLAKTSYLAQFPTDNYSRVHHDLIRALHRLIIEQGNSVPSFEEIKQTADFFATRN
jgi:hypothetical protein